MNSASPYRGRFAPSPTGPLHFGSLVAALGSYLQARHHDGQWYVRIEDIDPPREVPGAADSILRTLEALGLEWDGAVLYQSDRMEKYLAALDQLAALGLIYPCDCSRSVVAAHGQAGPEGWVYPGTCRNRQLRRSEPLSWRIRTHNEPIVFEDSLQGVRQHRLEEHFGDFVVKRAGGWIAYQLAVVVDDAAQGISEIVRGSDLLDSTTRQIYLQSLLGLPTPGYLHLPVATDGQGDKLSKQTGAKAIDGRNAARHLRDALAFLGQTLPPEHDRMDRDELLKWAIGHWDLHRIPRTRGLFWQPNSNTGP